MNKKVAIVGFSDISRDLAPYDDPEWEIWGTNHVYQYVPRVDRIFEIHKIGELEAKYGDAWPAYRKFLSEFRGPVYMLERREGFPTSCRLPIDELKSEFSFLNEEIKTTDVPVDVRTVLSRERKDAVTFKSTISYMVGMAILQGADVIGIYGVIIDTYSSMVIIIKKHLEVHGV